MDVRQLAFLARQPSATLQPRRSFWGLPKRGLAFLLANVMFWQPLWAMADGIVVNGSATSVGQAGNGVPVINIAKPNATGLSHNKFSDYNVGQQGVILNNSTSKVQKTQLGGYITGNGNLQGKAAKVILNEVNGGSPSQLKGYTEVAGKSAHVIVSNPHGITCDGCGFINTPKATLTTGRPVIDTKGQLKSYDVDGGAVTIEGRGLNASNVGSFEIITRSAQINAELHAKDLTIVTGRNEVDAKTLAATAKAPDGSQAPQLAIDSSALGGMYAGAIKLVGTESGVGVKLAGDMAASGGDLQIDVNGKLSMARASAAGDVKLQAQDIALNDTVYAAKKAKVVARNQVTVNKQLAAAGDVHLQGSQIVNQGQVNAGLDAEGGLDGNSHLHLEGGSLSNQGLINSQGRLSADLQQLDNRQGTLQATRGELRATVAGALDNRGGQLLTGAGLLTLSAAELHNQQGMISAQGGLLDVLAQSLNNDQGQLLGSGDLLLKGGDLANGRGLIQARNSVTVDAHSLSNGGSLGAKLVSLLLVGSLDNSNGLIESGSTLNVDAGALRNANGQLRALGTQGTSRFAIGGLFDNSQGLVEIGNARLSLNSVGLSNQQGTVRHLGREGFALSLADTGNAGGSFITNSRLDLDLADWTNTSVIQAQKIGLKVGTFTQSASGKLISIDGLEASGDHWINHGSLETDGDLRLTLSGSYQGNGGLKSLGNMSVSAASAELGEGADVRSGGQGTFVLGTHLINRGSITSTGQMLLQVASLNNQGTLGAGQSLRIEAPSLVNQGGLMFSGANMLLLSDNLLNLRGDLYSFGRLDMARDLNGSQAQGFHNLSGTVESVGGMSINAATLENARESVDIVTRKVAARMTYDSCYDCSGGKRNANFILEEIDRTYAENSSPRASLISGAEMTLTGGQVENRYSLLSSAGDLTIDALTFNNQGATLGEYNTQRFLNSYRSRSLGSIFRWVEGFNARNWPGGNGDIATEISQFIQSSTSDNYLLATPVYTPSQDLSYNAVVQAGGKVQINAQVIEQGVIRPSFAFVTGGSKVGDTHVGGSAIATPVTLNPQLAADTTQQPVDPLSLPGFSLPQGPGGLFHVNSDPGHPYLVESDPRFANLGNFLNSDYLLSRLGLDTDVAQRRLGDGLYEQRLIREAVLARTGQRFLAGLTSDEAMFRYLMDNAIASKDALDLAPGVALTSAQVAALTHDIVWMQEQEVQGQKVLVPVLYLAQANNRLAPNGALIQGTDVQLMAGSGLSNQGTLRASNSLLIGAENIDNSGLMEANQRLSLLATDSIRNAQGGILKGQDVTLVAQQGDVLNLRSVTTHDAAHANGTQRVDFVDKGARVEAGNLLLVSAGRDLQSVGSTLSAGGDAQLSAGRDLNIIAAEGLDSSTGQRKKAHWSKSQTTQYGSDVTVGGNLIASAGGDMAVVASKIKAGGDLSLAIDGNLNIASAANESHSEYHKKGGGKKLDVEDSVVRQQGSEIEAGGNLKAVAGGNLLLIASQLKSGGEAYLYGGKQLGMLAAENSDYHLYDKKKKGGWGSKETRRDEVTDVRYVGSTITTGGNLTVKSAGDQMYQVATLNSGKDLLIDSGGAITFEAVKDLHQESHERSKSDLAWTSAKGKGKTDETLRQTQLVAQGQMAIQAVDGLTIDVKQVDRQTVSQTIDAMVKGNPQLAWVKEAEQRGDVDWRQVKEVHDSFKYSHSSLGQGAVLAIIIVVTVLTAGAASSLAATGAAQGSAMAAASTTTATVGGVTTTTTVAAGWGNVMATSVMTSMASQGAVSVINNRGNLGAAFKDITTKDALKGYATGAVTAGFTSGVLDGAFGVTGDNVNKVTKGFNLSDWGDIGKFGLYSGAQGATHAIAQTAIQGGSFGDNLGSSLTNELQNALQGVAFNAVGGYSLEQKWADGSPQKVALHALVGGILSEASGQGFAVGAAAAGANEALSNSLSDLVKKDSKLQLAASQLVGLVAAGVVDGDLQTGANIAKNATAYNRQLHPEEVRRIKEKAAQLTAERGRPGFQDFTWEELLTIASDSQLDNSTANKYAALANKFAQESSRGNPLSSDFTQDMQVAQAAVTQMAQQGTPLTWNDGSAITAYGKPVLAFQATAEQKADSSLFGRTDYGSFGSMGGGNIALTGNQYGSKTALSKYSEISLFNGSSQRFDDLTERATSTVIPDLKTVTMLEFTPVGRAGAAGAAGAKAVAAGSGELLLVGGAKLVESKVIQANTTVQLSEAITLATGKVLPKGSVVTVSDDTMKVVYPNGAKELSSYSQSVSSPLALGGAKVTGGAAGKVDDLATSGLSSASNLPSGTGLGGLKVGLSADDITAINSQFGGSVSFREVDTAIANAANYDGFYNKAGSMVRDIAGGHLFDNGNKRTAVEVVEQLIIKNGVDGPPRQIIWNVVDKVATGKLTNVQDISKALRGLD